MTDIPLVDIVRQDEELREEIEKELQSLIATAAFIGGAPVERFEAAYAGFIGASFCVGLANGTDAVELALRGCGVRAGDEVIVPAFTFIATAAAVHRIGARPVLVDVTPSTLLIDPARVPAAVTERTTAVVPVHLFGQPAAVEALREALPAQVAIVEDAAQAQGAARFGRRAGTLGDVASTSFYPGKNLGAYGDAGAVTTDDREIAQAVRRFANHGGLRRYEHDVVGMNSRLDAIQAAVLGVKLRRLADWNAARQRAAARYDELLADAEWVGRPETADGNEHVWHQYTVRVAHRHEVLAALHRAGIGAAVHYPRPVHLTNAFAYLGLGRGVFPVAEAAAEQVLSLPMSPVLTASEQERVAAALLDATRAHGAPSGR